MFFLEKKIKCLGEFDVYIKICSFVKMYNFILYMFFWIYDVIYVFLYVRINIFFNKMCEFEFELYRVLFDVIYVD